MSFFPNLYCCSSLDSMNKDDALGLPNDLGEIDVVLAPTGSLLDKRLDGSFVSLLGN